MSAERSAAAASRPTAPSLSDCAPMAQERKVVTILFADTVQRDAPEASERLGANQPGANQMRCVLLTESERFFANQRPTQDIADSHFEQ